MMADEVDKANDYLETLTHASIANAQANTKTPENTTGQCIWCGDKVEDKRRWCSVECRDEFARHAK
jgi:hypothetical protein